MNAAPPEGMLPPRVTAVVSFGLIVRPLGMVSAPVGPVVGAGSGPALHDAPVLGRQGAVDVELEVPGAGVVGVAALVHDEEAAALDCGVGRHAGLHDRPLAEVGLHSGDLSAGTDRGRVRARERCRGAARRRQLLGEDVLELGVGLLIAVGVGVGDVVADRVDLGLHRGDARVGCGE